MCWCQCLFWCILSQVNTQEKEKQRPLHSTIQWNRLSNQWNMILVELYCQQRSSAEKINARQILHQVFDVTCIGSHKVFNITFIGSHHVFYITFIGLHQLFQIAFIESHQVFKIIFSTLRLVSGPLTYKCCDQLNVEFFPPFNDDMWEFWS